MTPCQVGTWVEEEYEVSIAVGKRNDQQEPTFMEHFQIPLWKSGPGS